MGGYHADGDVLHDLPDPVEIAFAHVKSSYTRPRR
jgi:hypothetical protein